MSVKKIMPKGGRKASPTLWAMVRGLSEEEWQLVSMMAVIRFKEPLQFKLLTLLRSMEVYDPAAEKAAPLIDSAQATMMAEQVQNLLGQNILSKLKGITRKSTPYTAGGGGIGEILKPMQGNTPTINIPMPQQNMPSLSIEQSGGGE